MELVLYHAFNNEIAIYSGGYKTTRHQDYCGAYSFWRPLEITLMSGWIVIGEL